MWEGTARTCLLEVVDAVVLLGIGKVPPAAQDITSCPTSAWTGMCEGEKAWEGGGLRTKACTGAVVWRLQSAHQPASCEG